MNFIKNIKIKYKLILLVSLPILFLFIMFFKIAYDGYIQRDKAKILNENIKLNIYISYVVDSLQEERDTSGFYLISNAENYKEEINTVRLESDKKIKSLIENIEKTDLKALPIKGEIYLEKFKTEILKLQKIRNIVILKKKSLKNQM